MCKLPSENFDNRHNKTPGIKGTIKINQPIMARRLYQLEQSSNIFKYIHDVMHLLSIR